MKTSYIVWIVVALVVIAGAYWFSQSTPSSEQTPAQSTTETTSSSDQSVTQATATAPITATVTYGPSGFSPSLVTIAKGGMVTFTNQSGGNMWVASAPHPTHEAYDGTTKDAHCASGYTGPAPFDQCSFGISYSYMFEKTGSWTYHNHANHSDTGTVVVQ